MEAYARSLDVVLSEKQQWVVPVYQRHYEWETRDGGQIPKFWEDLRDKAEEILDSRLPLPHYFGAILFSEPASQPFGSVRKRFLVDGQQRITTFTLALIAIREVARDLEIIRTQEVVDAYLFNEMSKGMLDPKREQHKLWPSAYDRQLYLDLVANPKVGIQGLHPNCFFKNGKLIRGKAPNLLLAYWTLYEAVMEYIKDRESNSGTSAPDTLDALVKGLLSGLQVVMIHLDEKDDAQEIFASLNGLAKPLSPFDLIRNDVFHRARKLGEDDERLFDERWKEFEQPFWNTQVRQGRFLRSRADHLVGHAVVAETSREVNAGKIASEYRYYARERAFTSVAEELDVLLVHAKTYRGMEELSSPITNRLTSVLRSWDISTLHPVVLRLMAGGHDDDKVAILKVLESYIVRREICGLTTKNYNKVAIMMIRALGEHGLDPRNFARTLVELTGDASRMPADDEVLEAATSRPIYGSTPPMRLRYIFKCLEYAKRTKFEETTLDTSNLTIEHVMPQKWAQYWPLRSGKSAPAESSIQAIALGIVVDESMQREMELRRQLINTLGNLTLVTGSLNPSLSNGAWREKREKLAKSLLVINRGLAAAETWDEDGIKARSTELGRLAAHVWPIPV